MSGTTTVWGLHNGEKGDQLPALTRMEGPFPPIEDSKGWVSVGWPSVGDMRMWKDDYKTLFAKFQLLYGSSYKTAMAAAAAANIPWYFAFDMKVGDWVICPCSSEGLLLVGQIAGEYESSWDHETPGLRPDFIHLRPVRWQHVIKSSDARFGKLNRIGQLTLSRQKLSVDQLQAILDAREKADA